MTTPCRSCGAPIDFVITPAGKYMPVDPGKRVTIVTDGGEVRSGLIPHWATCPTPEKHRKQKI